MSGFLKAIKCLIRNIIPYSGKKMFQNMYCTSNLQVKSLNLIYSPETEKTLLLNFNV